MVAIVVSTTGMFTSSKGPVTLDHGAQRPCGCRHRRADAEPDTDAPAPFCFGPAEQFLGLLPDRPLDLQDWLQAQAASQAQCAMSTGGETGMSRE